MRRSNILDVGTNLEQRLQDFNQIVRTVDALRALGQRIVLTSGTYDIIHVGHANYLEKARALGDFLIVGVDSDAKVRARKGPGRPIVPENERLLMLAHLRHVDALVLKPADEEPHQLMKLVRPDVLVISETTKHSAENIEDMHKYCGVVEMLPPQAETSTTAQIRRLHIDGIGKFAEQTREEVGQAIDRLLEKIQSGG